MNIVLVGTAFPLRGGIAHYIGLLWKYLGRTHQVRVVTFSRQYPKFLFPGTSQEESGDAGIPLESAQWIDSINPLTWLRTGLRIRAMRPDLVIFKYWMPFFAPAYGVIAALVRCRRPTVTMFICDNVIPHERRPGDKLLTRFAFRFIDSYVVQSRAVERDLALWKKEPLYALLPHPVYEIFGEEGDRDTARAALGRINPDLAPRAPGERVLLFFGYVREYKGLDVLLEAMPLILARMPVRLFVVGEFYNDEERYRSQVQRLGIADAVAFHASYVPNEQVATFFSAADILTLPYKSATQSGIIQIAYNFHRPVIATDVGGLGEVIVDGRTGYIVPPDDPPALARAVCDFYRQDAAAAFRENVIVEKRKYSWEHFCAGIEELYGRACAQRPRNHTR